MPKRRERGSGSVYVRKDGRVVGEFILGLDPAGHRQMWRCYGTSRRQVSERLAKAIADRGAGKLAVPGRLTVGDFLTRWLTTVEPSVKPSTAALYSVAVAKHIGPALGHVQLAKLDRLMVQTWIASLQRAGLSPSYIHTLYSVLKIALNAAVDWEILAVSPAVRTKLPRVERRPFAAWTPETVRQLLSQLAGDPDEPLAWVAVCSGARAGELFGLRWADVDWQQSAIRITQSVTRVAGRHVTGDTKTAGSSRTVVLPVRAMGLLRVQRQRIAAAQLEARDWQDNNLVFPAPSGRPSDGQGFVKRVNAVTSAIGLPRITLRDMRHLHASLLLAWGANPKVVQERLGHSSITQTMDTYSHLLGNLDREAAVALGETLG